MRSIPARPASPQSVFARPTTRHNQNSNSHSSQTQRRQPTRLCPLCKQAGRNSTNHFLSTCTYLPDSDRRFMTKARLIASIDEQFENEPAEPDVLEELPSVPLEDCSVVEPVGHGVARRVETKESPYLHVFFQPSCLENNLRLGCRNQLD